jgi:hypothetical protein
MASFFRRGAASSGRIRCGRVQADNGDAYLLQRLRFNMKIRPAGWLTVFVQTEDARVFWKNQILAPPFRGYVGPALGLRRGGRYGKISHCAAPGINLGEERLVGNAWWGNTPRSFDAARLALHYRKVRLDIFASSVVVSHSGQVGSVQPGNNLHGPYGGLSTSSRTPR